MLIHSATCSIVRELISNLFSTYKKIKSKEYSLVLIGPAIGKLTKPVFLLINWEKCMSCGVCIDKCPNNVLTMVRDEEKGVPLESNC